ncbi:TetR/AcrR family transcriptional regulator [Corynebacterium lipophiloflavum]|uniref:Transcriptional regulator, TetR family n=1 Tax=Corynebacterium lipophiloflavum (strain ATCC 700352 / DSM 44291 / CCUG 37336 / JCM 10383 / DMMZ 1944) TaxID=525263 RepID=C0XS40_CORLD|nr:TetR family transcriptional regulator [Corynebacterium lipophiloflavum]EEI16935.1 transcriptional regulator, TetR family [Corynebacterium lipophiloflavum DSM 44291]
MHSSLSRESISRQGLKILDEYGLADVTMRRVASSLGVAPGALYWHISNKQELIAGIAALIVAPLVDAPPADAPTPAALCAALRATLLRHRDGAEVVTTAMSQPGSTVARELTRIMREAIARELVEARREASTSNVHSVADGLLYMTLGATGVHQAAAQLAEATGATTTDAADTTDVAAAISLLLKGLRDGSDPAPTTP